MRDWFVWICALFVSLLIEFLWDTLANGQLAPPNLVILCGVLVAISAGARRGAFLVGLAALLTELAGYQPNGVETLAGVAVGWFAGHLGRRLVLDGWPARYLVAIAALAAHAGLVMAGDTMLNGGVVPPYDYQGLVAALFLLPIYDLALLNIQLTDEERSRAWQVSARP